jgi:hypothetical protein
MLHAEGKKQRDPLSLSSFLAHDRSSFLGLALRSLPILLSACLGLGLIFLAHGTGFSFVAGIGAVGLIVFILFLTIKYG